MPLCCQNGSNRSAIAAFLASLALAVPLRAANYPLTQFDELRGVIIRDILEDSRREVWLAADDGLWHYDVDEFKRFQGWEDAGSATALVEDEGGLLWVGTPDGIIRLDPASHVVDAETRLLRKHWILCLRRDSEGFIWAGTNHGLVRLDPAASGATPHTVASTEKHPVHCVAFTAAGDVLAGSRGVMLRVRDAAVVERESNLPGERLVRAILEARDGSLWIGLRFGGGLVRIREGQLRWFGVDDGLIDQEVNVIVEHPDGSIFIATENGLFRYVDDRFVLIGEENGLDNTDLHGLWCDREGNVWIGTYGAGVVLLRSADVITFDMNDGLRHPVVTGAGRLDDGRLIFATIHGATIFDTESGRMQDIDPATHLNTAHTTSSGKVILGGPGGISAAGDTRLSPVGAEVLAIDDDQAGGLWIGTTRGLYRQSSGQITAVTLPEQAGPWVNAVQALPDGCLVGTRLGLWQLAGEAWRNIVSGSEVRCMLPGVDSLWVGTTREVLVFQPDHTTIASRIAVGDVRSLARQNDETVWAATRAGLVRIRGGDVDRYFPADGLPSADVRCLLFDADGHLYAGTTQGVVRIRTDRFSPCDTPPAIAVRAFIVGGAYHDGVLDHLRIDSKNAALTLRLYPRGMRSAVGVHYQYRLTGGVDDAWSAPTADPVFRAEGLPRGQYTLHARCVNAHGLFSENEIALAFSVHPPALMPPWLAAITGIAGVGALTLAGVYRRKRRQFVAERLQAQAALLESERRLQAILDNTTAVIYLKDREGRYLLVNRQFEMLFNVTRTELVGRTDYDLFPRSRAEAFRQNDRLVLQSGRALEFDEVVPQRDGLHDYLSIKFPLFDADGRPSAVCGVSTDITERKRVEQSLRESERYNRALFEKSPVGLALCHMDGELVDVNEAYARIVGRTPQEVLGLSYWEITPRKYADQEREQLELLLQTGSYGPYEKVYIHKDGHLVPVRLSGMILERGGERFIWSSVEDITEQHRADEAIRTNERRLRELTAAVPGAVYQFRIDPDGSRSFPFISDGIQGLFEVSPQQVLADPEIMFRTIHPDDLPALEQSIRHSKATFSDWLHECRVVTASGKEKWIRGNAVPRKIDDDAMIWTGVLVDISALKHAEDMLRRQAMVFEHMYDGVILTDSEGRITGWNKGAERMFGYTLEEVIGRSPEMFNRPEEAAAITNRIRSALHKHGRWSGELTFLRKDGSEGVCEAVAVLYRDEHGLVGPTISVNRDVTARKLAEQRAQQHQAELARVARFTALGEMTAGIAHQLNQPLAALCNFVRGCERRMVQEGRYAPDMLGAMGKAVEQAERASEIIRRVRSLIRHEESARTPTNLNKLVRGVVELAEVKSRSNGAPLRLELDPVLPMVKVDPIQIEQMMINLIANAYDAIKASGPGRHEVAIRTHTTDQGDVVVEVRDSGIGLHVENIDRAFEPFYSTKAEGLGIGLSISRTIAANNGGKLVAVPAEGRGAVLRLTLPPTKGEDEDES